MYLMIYHQPGYEDWCNWSDGETQENLSELDAYNLKWQLLLDGARQEIREDGEHNYIEYIIPQGENVIV